MTLWQDKPPQTRREAREMERAAALTQNHDEKSAPEAKAPKREVTEQPPSADAQAVPEPQPVTTGARSSAASGDASSAQAGAPKVAAHFASRPYGAARPQLPNYETSFDALLAPEAAEGLDDADDDQEVSSSAEDLSRLFSPVSAREDESDSRETSGDDEGSLYRDSAATGEVEPVTTPVSVVPTGSRPFADDAAKPVGGGPVTDNHDEPAPRRDVEPEAVPAPPVSGGMAPSEKTMTRRELRAMLQSEQLRRDPSGVEPQATVQPQPAAGPQPAAEPQPDVEARGVIRPQTDFRSEPVAPSSAAALPAAFETVSIETVRAEAAKSEPSTSEPVRADSARAETEKVETEATKSPEPAVNHWSRAGETDRQNEAFDQILSRGVGPSGGETTTSALILPSIPTAPPATGPITATGEILVTGSIDLPRGLGSTGQHPDRYDTSEMDRMFDEDEMNNTSDVEPIRASHAVSGHTSTRGVITPPKKNRGRLPVVLSITAGALLIAVVGLLVVGYVLKVF